MAANMLRLRSLELLHRYNIFNAYVVKKSRYSTTESTTDEERPIETISGFAKFDQKQVKLMEESKQPEDSPQEPSETFVSLLKKSNFIAMGNPVGKIVVGEIYHVVGRDLYIDFGWKFPTVCTAPEKKTDLYVPGTKVKLLVKDLELCTKFLGGEEVISLNEADCVLLGLLRPPQRK